MIELSTAAALEHRQESVLLRHRPAVLLSMALAIVALAGQAKEKPRGSDLSGPWQLFVDDYLVAQAEGVARVYHAFEKHPGNPVQGIQKYGGRGTALLAEDGAGYRLWCSGGKNHYVSADGLTWDRPVRPVRETQDSQGCCSVIHTPWESDPAQRFKMVSLAYVESLRKDKLDKGGGWYGWVSPDGLHWTSTQRAPLFRDRSDVGKFGWDAHRQRYFGTPKIWTNVRGHLRRCIGLSASPQFDAPWPAAQLMLVPDSLDDAWARSPEQHTQFYGLSAFAYESIYLGLLEVFRVTDGINDGTIHIELVTSRDGVRWDRLPGERRPILPVGPPGAWDAGMIKTPSQPIVEGDQIKLFYGANNQTHGFGRSYHETAGRAAERADGTGLATLRKDGFASLDAGAAPGTITTVPLPGARGPLAINYRAREGGWIKVEVLDVSGNVLRGYSKDECPALTGDSVNAAVKWREFGALPAERRVVRLRFVLRNASLYSFNAGDTVRVERRRPELAALYTFESQTTSDELTEDGAQGLFLQNAVKVDRDKHNAAFGNASVAFRGDDAGRPAKLEIDQTFRLDERFTLAAMVKPAATGRMRLFSAWDPYPVRVNEPPYQREGVFGTKELILDFDAAKGDANGRLRLAVQGREVSARGAIQPGQYHHVAATYDDGAVSLYLDGQRIGGGRVPGGEVTLLANLRVGGDLGPMSTRAAGLNNGAQLIGNVDDVVVLGRALSADDIRALRLQGTAFLSTAKTSADNRSTP